MIQINQHRSFSKKSDYAAFATVRVHNSRLKELGGRNAWIYIQPAGKKEGVYRTVRGNGSISPFPEDAIELDYDTSVELGIHDTGAVASEEHSEEKFYTCDLKVHSVRGLKKIRAHWNHPDPAYRVPLQISIVLGSLSVILGIIGVILGVMSVVGV
jgi:hypothetical protein